MPRSLLLLAATTLLTASLSGCAPDASAPEGLDASALATEAPDLDPHGPGADCGSCHAAQRDAWDGSDHARALGAADSEQVRARFDGVPVVLPGLTATPMLLDGKPSFSIEDGAGVRQLPVALVVGHDPLQQVLLDGPRGELLVAPVAWDIDAERWFDPSVDGVAGDPADPLYWGGIAGTFDHQCAGCHATGVVKRFDPVQGRYDTTWDEPHVACAACHGDPAAGDLADMTDKVAVQDTCAACHGRRDPIAPGFRPGDALLDFFAPELLASVAYTPDGGIVDGDEAFVYGSFSQSRMHAAGVTCVDCHDPHSGETVADGNALCASCHDAERFDAVEHHRHEPGTPGAQCVECHMPEATYMGVDQRRDHHIRVPDPALAAELGVRDACSRCHGQVPGPLPASYRLADADFARLIAAARAGDPNAAPGLREALADLELVPFRRASALQLLARFAPQESEPEAAAALADDDALVRAAAAELLGGWGLHLADVSPLLVDPVRAVRFAALRGLAGHPGVDDRAIAEVLFEWERSSLPDVDLPSTWTNQAVLRARLGDRRSAVAALRVALRLDPDFQPALANLAALTGGSNRP